MSLYAQTAPVFIGKLNSLSGFLSKAEAAAGAGGYDVAVLLNARLAPDMHPLVRQVQMTADHAKFAMARMGGVEGPSFPDTETSVAELKDRIAKTIAFVQGVPAEKIEASAGREIAFKAGPMELKMSGTDYLATWALPNFYFHLTAAYSILRHNGVSLGKLDFLRPPA
ncbi:MAG: DUF1993 family protein [Hyphomonadaceae bacterium]